MTTSTTSYVLDNQNRIISVDGAWDKFADENGGINLSSTDVCGRQIWEFVAGDVTRMWLETVFQFARLRCTRIERPYRCDSPTLKRFMRMRIDFEAGGILRIEHEVLATEQRATPVHFQYRANPKNNFRQRCSFCGRLNDGGWKEPLAEHADASINIIVIYTVCEDCQRLLPGT